MDKKRLKALSVIIVITGIAWFVLPIIIYGDRYIFTVHDGLDSYAGIVEFVHKKGLFFKMNQSMPFMNGIQGKYTFLTYNLYDLLNCTFGYLHGQIIVRIVSAFVGYFSTKKMFDYLFKDKDDYVDCVCMLASVIYTVTPVAPNRMIAFASLPMVITLFLYLRERRKLSGFVFVGIVVPILSIFDAVLFFVLGFWFLFGIIDWIKTKKININVCISFVLMCISTVIVNINFLRVALTAEQTNRGLMVADDSKLNFDVKLFVSYLLDGQYHSSGLHRKIVLPFAFICTIVVFLSFLKNRERKMMPVSSIFIVVFGWFMWIFSAFILTFQESGFSTGFIIIDGFQWGRLIGFMRLIWYIMLVALIMLLNRTRIWKYLIFGVLCLQLYNVINSPVMYNENYMTLHNKYDTQVNFKEFFDEELFSLIKSDINYTDEVVVAYGYHPAVLMYNGFVTLDGYMSVHSMEYQNQFREIIKPELERNESYQQYYDTWGGRMYIFGDAGYFPTKEKEINPCDLYIDVDAFVKYNGRYILSKVEIKNADDLGIELVNDYTLENNIYHIYLYSTKGESNE